VRGDAEVVANAVKFKKGVSGNPGGRPKRRLITSELNKILNARDPESGRKGARVLAERMVQIAKGPDEQSAVRAIKEIADRVEGRTEQQITFDTNTVAQAVRQAHDQAMEELKDLPEPRPQGESSSVLVGDEKPN
jgi:Family of unknown function (DUF5681)